MAAVSKALKRLYSILSADSFLRLGSLLIYGALGLAASQTALATPSCSIQPNGAVAQSGTVNTSLTYTFDIVDQEGGCAATVSGTITAGADTTGGASADSSVWSDKPGSTISVTVTLGPSGGGQAQFDIDCPSVNCFNGNANISLTANTYDVHQYSAATATSLVTNQLSTVAVGTHLLTNGAPGTYATTFDNLTTASTLATVSPDSLGNAMHSFGSSTAKTYAIAGSLNCPSSTTDPDCPPSSSPIAYSVVVEPTGMSAVSPSNTPAPPDSVTTLTAYYGSANAPAPDGVKVSWSIKTQPSGGDGALGKITDTIGGNTSSDFTATVPGIYIVTANSGCTFCSGPISVDFSVTVTTPVAVKSLTIVSGDQQTGATGTTLPMPLTVLAQDDGNNAPGVVINWLVTSGDATLSTASSTTRADGRAGVNLTFGSSPGTVTVSATRADDGTQVNFTETSTLNRTLVVTGGNNQTGPVNTALASPLIVTALNNGNAAPGITVHWAVTSGDATLSSPSSITESNGQTRVHLTFGDTPGPVTVSATRADDSTATTVFNAASTSIRALFPASGNNQFGPVNTTLPAALVVTAQNDGVAAPGVTVQWAVTSGDATVSSPSSITDSSGQASVNLTFGTTPGPVTVTGTRTDAIPAATATFNATSVLVRTLAVTSGDNQTGAINSTLPIALVVTALDNAIAAPGVTVNWAVTSGDATVSSPSSVTDGQGRASISLSFGGTAGPVTVSAIRADDPGAAATFNATSTVARTLIIVSGVNQTGAPDSALTAPFIVQALDNGTAATEVAIEWSIVSGGGRMAPSSSTTDAEGKASSTLTLGSEPEPVKVTATRTDDASASVTFTANAVLLSALPGLSPEQEAVADTIDTLCPALADTTSTDPNVLDLMLRCNELLSGADSDPNGVGNALGQLVADVALAQSEAGLLAAQAQFDNINARIAAVRGGSRGTSFAGLALSTSQGLLPIGALFDGFLSATDEEPGEIGADFSRWGFFASGTLGRGKVEAGSTNPGYDFDINGLTVGADYRRSDKLIVGGSLGYTRQTSDLAQNRGELDSDGWSLSAYGTYYRNERWYTDALLSFGRNDYRMLRRLSYTFALPSGETVAIDQIGQADYSGDSLSFAASFGRDFHKNGWAFGPYLRTMYTKLSFDSLTETFIAGVPGSGLALVVDSNEVVSLSGVLGGKLTYAHSTAWGVLSPHAQVEWQHEFRSDPSAAEAHFLYDPTATGFTVTGDEIDSDYFRFGVGLSLVMTHGRSGFFYYEKILSRERMSQYSLTLGLRLEF